MKFSRAGGVPVLVPALYHPLCRFISRHISRTGTRGEGLFMNADKFRSRHIQFGVDNKMGQQWIFGHVILRASPETWKKVVYTSV